MILTSKIPLRPRLTHAIAKIGLNTKRESEPKHAPCMLKCLREIAPQDVEKSMLLKKIRKIFQLIVFFLWVENDNCIYNNIIREKRKIQICLITSLFENDRKRNSNDNRILFFSISDICVSKKIKTKNLET